MYQPSNISPFASKILLLLALLVPSTGLFAQIKQLSFDYLTADDGLSGNYVSCIFRDSNDFLWIGTNEQGVNKYNGYTFTLYENKQDELRSLSDNNITCVFEDSKNNIWIGTAGGLNLYDPETETFTVYKHSDDPESLGSNRVYKIFEDKNQDLWIVCGNEGGLNKWIPETEKFIRYFIPKTVNGIEGVNNRNSHASVSPDSKGIFWIANSGPDLYSFDPNTSTYHLFRSQEQKLSGGSFKTMCIDKEDNLWVASHKDGLFMFNTNTYEYKFYGKEIGLKGNPDRTLADIILEDNDHILIAANQGGISRFDKKKETFEDITAENRNSSGLNSLGVRSIYIDKEGIFWVGTTRGGVNYYNPKKQKFNIIKHPGNSSSGNIRNIIGWIYEDSQGLIWLATDGAGLDVYDPKSGDFKNYSYEPKNPYSLSGNVVRCIEEDDNGDFWIGTWGNGLNFLDTQSGKFYRYSTESQPISINNNSVWNFKIHPNGNLWLTPFSGGVDVFNRKDGVVDKLRDYPHESKRIPDNLVRYIYEDLDQNMWVCSVLGINKIARNTNLITTYSSFPDNDIKVMCQSLDGTYWAGSVNGGLFQFDLTGNILKVYNEASGLSNNSIVSILEDNSGRIWAATKKGLNAIDPASGVINKFYKVDGLQSDLFFELSACKSSSGLLYFGGYDGFNYFHPDSIKLNDFIPKIYFTDFKIYNKSVKAGEDNSLLTKHISLTKEIIIPSNITVFSLEFAAINYTNSNKTRYAYMLEGFDKEWNYIEEKRDATYTNLEPGKYEFKVKATNNDGIWNEEGKSLKIIVKPAFWQTWTFKAISVFLLLSLLFTVYFIRLLRIRQRQLELTQLVADRTKELEYRRKEIEGQAEKLKQQNHELENQKHELNHALNELQETQAQLLHSEKMASLGVLTAGMAHEINNPLNFIQTGLYAADVVMQDENIHSSTLRDILTKMNEGVQRASSIVKSLNTFSRKSGASVRHCDIHKIIDNALFILDHEVKYKCDVVKNYSAKNVNFDLTGSEENLHQVFINVIMNASHAFKEAGVLTISTEIKRNKLQIIIEDNGIGIPTDILNQIFDPFFTTKEPGKGVGLGLSVVYKIITEHKGTIKYESEVNKGTTVIITLPIQINSK